MSRAEVRVAGEPVGRIGPGLYEYFVRRLRGAGLTVATGQFKARMNVTLINDGPVTLIVES